MSQNVEELLREACELPETERAKLAGRLLDTLDEQAEEAIEAAWAEEVERRVRQLESGEVKTIPWEEVRAKLYARLNERR
jgi:putative addiction module component (TIGR02574 family)